MVSTFEVNLNFTHEIIKLTGVTKTLLNEINNIEGVNDYAIISHNNGVALSIDLENGFTLSCIKSSSSYGARHDMWEIAILRNDELRYDTDFTYDVETCNHNELPEFIMKAIKLNEYGKLKEE
jgi:hypothetical protein